MANRNRTLKIESVRAKKSPRSGRAKIVIIAVFMFVLVAVGVFFLIKFLDSASIKKTDPDRQRIEKLGVSTEIVSEKARDEHQVAPNHPRYLSIPSINVERARVLALGADKNNQMAAPASAYDVGWYSSNYPKDFGACSNRQKLPGDGQTDCAAVLDGHTCFSNGLNCVFDNLPKLKTGDQIIIERGDGSKINYRIRAVETVKLVDVDMAKAMKPIESGRDGLTLITCAGVYDGTTDSGGVLTADKRVLVYAVAE